VLGILTAVTAAVSIGLVAWFGFGHVGDPANATWTLAIYTLAALGAAIWLDRDDLARIGSALLLATLVQVIVYRYQWRWTPGELSIVWITALLAHATLASIIAAVSRWWPQRTAVRAMHWLLWTAQVTSVVAAVWIVASVHQSPARILCINLLWLAGVWTLFAAVVASPRWYTAAQVALVLSIVSGVTAAVASRTWYVAAPHPWLDPWFLEAQGIALSGYCLLIAGLRVLLLRLARPYDTPTDSTSPSWAESISRLLSRPWPAVDRIVAASLVVLVMCVATYAALPGAAQELAPRSAAGVPPIQEYEIASVVHAHAAGRGAWDLLGAVIAALAAGLYQRGAAWHVFGLVLVAFAVCPLLAARWEAELAVASALRWLSAGLFAVASIGLWIVGGAGWLGSSGGWLGSSLRRAPSNDAEAANAETIRQVRDLLVALIVLVYVVMGAYVVQGAILRAGMPSDATWFLPYVLLWAVVLGAAAIAVRRDSVASATGGYIEALGGRTNWVVNARDAMLVLAIAPPAILLTFVVARGLDQFPITGPLPTSWFRRIGFAASYGVPLAAIALVFIGYAVRDRSSRFAFSAGLLFNVVATIVVLLRFARGGATLDATAWIVVAQVNAIVTGVVALAWMAAIEWHWRRELSASRVVHDPGTGTDAQRWSDPGTGAEPSPDPSPKGRAMYGWPLLLVTQVVLAAGLCAMFLAPAVARLVARPDALTWAAAADGVLGWSAVFLATVAAFWLRWGRRIPQSRLAILIVALVALVALTAARWDTGNWLAYHTLLAGACIAAWLLPVATPVLDRALNGGVETQAIAWSAPPARLFGLAAVLLAAWGYSTDPFSPWWTLVALLAITGRAVWIAWHERRSGFLWVAAGLLLPAASIFWVDWADQFSSIVGLGEIGQLFEFLWINVLAASLLAIIGVVVTRRQLTSPTAEARPSRGIAFHRFAAWAIVGTLLLTTLVGLLADLWGQSFPVTVPLAWAAWFAAAATALACWWDPAVRWPVACLYCVGLLAVGIYLDGLNFTAPMFHWALALALSAYSLATSALWSARDKLWSLARRWNFPAAAASGHVWLVAANIVLGVVALLLIAWVETTMPELSRRMIAAYAVAAQAFAIGLLARGTVRTSLQYLALVWGVLFAVAFAWAWMRPDFPAPWLHRLVLAVIALVVTVVVYGFGLVKFLRRDNEWTRAAARFVPSLAGLAVLLIMAVLAIEVRTFLQSPTREVPIVMPALVAVGLSLVGLIVAVMVAALAPGRDPLGLSERGRTAYVYIAEGLAALLFVHIRVTMPWLFRGWLIQFWPLVVMGIAFVGVGFGELFSRRRQRVLAEPLQNTGVLLPLLPAIGFWLLPTSRVNYSLLLLSVAVLYTAMSALKRSLWYAALAAAAANVSLWYWLHTQQGFGILEHPQLWLIPPALCALVAGFINRERLTADQSAALRYAAAIVIYASSTADIFINGVANAPWLPAVLAALSILGVLAGIMLRVRAFLYLGTTFLVVAIITVIWHAAIREQHTWILWVAGIITGALIIALFGLFEKRRDDVLRVVQQLQQWEA
jgi:hypothetical protein